jgi:hypothetical protein
MFGLDLVDLQPGMAPPRTHLSMLSVIWVPSQSFTFHQGRVIQSFGTLNTVKCMLNTINTYNTIVFNTYLKHFGNANFWPKMDSNRPNITQTVSNSFPIHCMLLIYRGACRPPKFRPDKELTFFCVFPFHTPSLPVCAIQKAFIHLHNSFCTKLCNPEDLCTKLHCLQCQNLPNAAKQSRHLYYDTQRRFSPPGQVLHAFVPARASKNHLSL